MMWASPNDVVPAYADTNEKSESKALGFFGWGSRIRTYECQSQSLVPYRLAISQYS